MTPLKPTVVAIDAKGDAIWELRPAPEADRAWLAKRNSTGERK